MDGEAAFGGDLFLACFYSAVVELFDVPALQTYDVIMMFAVVEFENRFVAFKMVAYQQAGMLELGEYAVYRGQADILAAAAQDVVDVFCAQVALFAALKQSQHFQSWQGCLEAGALQIFGLVGGCIFQGVNNQLVGHLGRACNTRGEDYDNYHCFGKKQR